MAFGVSNSFKRFVILEIPDTVCIFQHLMLTRGTVTTYAKRRACADYCNDIGQRRIRIRMDPDGATRKEFLDGTLISQDKSIYEDKIKVTTIKPENFSTSNGPHSSAGVPSSLVPADCTACSFDTPGEESALSSPTSSTPPAFPSRKPTFSILKRKRPPTDDGAETSALSEIDPNMRKEGSSRAAKSRMTQMQIDLGGELRQTCRCCGMEFIPSVKVDAALHKEFCSLNVGGVDLGKKFLKDATIKKVRSERAARFERDSVVLIDRRSSAAVKNKSKKVMDIVNTELSAMDISDEVLWSALDPKPIEKQTSSKRREVSTEEHNRRGDRFKAFLYMVEDKCVGVCLTEKISRGFPVMSSRPTSVDKDYSGIIATSKSSSVSIMTNAKVVLLGISRIWTSKAYRNQGIAIELLECARSNFFYGVQVPKNLVALSQPTESGKRLAERWFEVETGWCLYRGDV